MMLGRLKYKSSAQHHKPLVPELSTFKGEMAVQKFKSYKGVLVCQILAKLI